MATKTHSIIDLIKVAEGKKEPPACDKTLQVEVIEANDGQAKGIWTVDDKFINGHGVAMGGFVSGAVDIIMAYAIASKLSDTSNKGFASIDLDTTFHRPVVKGKVNITANVDRCGRSVAYLTATIEQNGKLVANSVSSMFII